MTEERNAHQGESSALGQSTTEFVLVGAAFLAVGAGVGWLVKTLAKWIVTLPWAPLQGPAELLTELPEPALTIAVVCAGALLGIGIVVYGRFEDLSAEISNADIALTRKGQTTQIVGSDVAMVFLDGNQFVVLGRDGGELAREKCDFKKGRVAEAIRSHGYTWVDRDPHKDDYRPWVPETPGLPEGANALLKARSLALKKRDSDDELRELREELARMGVVVRDEKARQYWRLAGSRR
ncbi:hypothetical protein ACFV30_29750 [Streptomyces sp. NPDC059752]|uniref:YqeB family protein n=1 Tax=unclassified Streptomyces TaxID=2593676 RepID=UPI00364E589F